MVMHTYDAILVAPMCRLGACFSGGALSRLTFLHADNAPAPTALNARDRRLSDELEAYWRDPGHRFGLPVAPAGTLFQLRVWRALLSIPIDQPVTYGALARRLDTSARAIGQACGSNPLPILFPCHRVVAAKGIGGFMHASAGASLNVKSWLLAHEHRPHGPCHE